MRTLLMGDKEDFYKLYRKLFNEKLTEKQVENMEVFFDSCVKYIAYFNTDVYAQQLAYTWATVKHETGNTYGAFKEVRQVRVDTPRRKEVRRLQDRYWYTGYYGRGPVQLTWDYNYKWAQSITGKPLLKDPDILLRDLETGYHITIYGMALGKFTGRRLSNYINKDKVDYRQARRVVNGLDAADKIAGYARIFERIFKEVLE